MPDRDDPAGADPVGFPPAMEHRFEGHAYSLGIEEELMILDGDTHELVNAIEALLESSPRGAIKPELMESVLEISTDPCADMAEAGSQLRALRQQVSQTAAAKGMAIGSAGTHPFAMWEDQRIVARPRYRDIISALRFVARQELIFGMHVHVGVDGPDKAIHVANGMRIHLPILLALSANSPFWRAQSTGMASTRMPIFRAFPRVGMPPAYDDWDDYVRGEPERVLDMGLGVHHPHLDGAEHRVGAYVVPQVGVVLDDSGTGHEVDALHVVVPVVVRPHAMFGTVEVRVMDSQTHIEHSLGLAALVQAMVKELAEHFDAGKQLSNYPHEMLDENKWLAARHGLEGELVDLPSSERVTTRALARRVIDRMREHCQELGSESDLEAVDDLLSRGNGAARQVVVFEANNDLHEVMSEIVIATRV
jgi:carboxylate-amine ligase